MLHIDFETRSRIDLRAVGTTVYAAHPSTELLCCAFAYKDNPVDLWAKGDPPPARLFEYLARGGLVYAHNAFFERTIWRFICLDRLGWPDIAPDRWRCTLAQAAALGLPSSLEKAAEALELPVQKDLVGNRLMLQMSKPRKPTKTNPSEWFEDPERLARLFEYCKQDVEVERALHAAIPELTPAELEIWQLDQTINARGIPIDRSLLDYLERVSCETLKQNNRELAEITGDAVTSVTQRNAMIEWLGSRGVKITDLSRGNVERVTLRNDIPADARKVLELRLASAKSSIKKLSAIRHRSHGNRVHDGHGYYKAHTGRWAGKGIQIQNFPRGEVPQEQVIRAVNCNAITEVFEKPLDAVSSALRGCIAHPAGLTICDFASIEARVLAWLAQDQTLQAIFARGGDPYVTLAAEIYGVTEEEVTKPQRQIGKICVLGLGYCMGPDKFQATLLSFGREVSRVFAARCVDIYRATFPAVKDFWYCLEHAAKDSISYPGIEMKPRHNVTFVFRDRKIECELPSGRRLYYWHPRLVGEHTQWGPKTSLTYKSVEIGGNWGYTKTYGGKLAENLVQAVSRDFLAAALLRVERAGLEPLFHVHDEIVTTGNHTTELERLMVELPLWATGAYIAAEAQFVDRYTK